MRERHGRPFIGRRSLGYNIGQCVNYALLTLLGLVTLYPFWYCLIISFNSGTDALAGGIYFIPRLFTFENYVKAFQHPLIMSAFSISVSRTLLVITCGCFFTSLLAYAMTRRSLPGRSFLIFYFYFTTLFSGGLIPTYIMYRQMGILNTFWVMVLPSFYSFFFMIILRTFFYTIPDSLQESARIDGTSEIGIYFRIMLPLSVPAMATIALFFGVGAWNDWFAGEYFVSRRRDLWPAATLLRDLLSQATFETNPQDVGFGNTTASDVMVANAASTTPESLRMAFLIILTTPIICIYPFLQKFFVTGIMVGSIKE